MSLLGKLFSGSTTNSQRTPHSLDSNLEDAFTHSLLFPDAEALCHTDQVFTLSSATVLPAAVNAFDINADLDLEVRDVRVIIMQEATPISGSAYLLYDSHPPPPPSPSPAPDRHVSSPPAPGSRSEGRRSISSPRKTSVGQNSRPLVIQQELPPRTYGAFDRRPLHNKQLSYNETEIQRATREYREEVAMFSNCIFGNSDVLAYKGTGTKVHPLPSDSRTTTSSSYMTEGSLGRSGMRSKLAQSFTSENYTSAPTSAGYINTNITTRGSDRKRVLITRMFPVPLPNDEADNQTPTALEQAAGYPFPEVGPDLERKKPQPKQKRTPMYAVGLIIHLPATTPNVSAAPASRSFRGSGSYNEQDSFPSSFNSSRRSGWTMLGQGFGVESLESSICSDVDDRMDTMAQHWDIIMRTMSHLQAVATATLLPMLKHADISTPEPRSHHRTFSASVSIAGKRVEDSKPFKMAKTNSKMVQLQSNCLMPLQHIQKEVDGSRQRIVSGIKASRVVTGQGRWGIWREEARTVGKWAGGRDEGFFFFNLLTGFLGNHTEWLQALSPSWYRQRHSQQHQSHRDNDISIPARTIIISDNKLMARRLIFLLSAFLPSNQQTLPGRVHRPSTSISFGGYSQSPPNSVPILREESLRRRMNKKPSIVRGSHNRTMSFPAQAGHSLEIHHHDRRPSDAASIKTANLPIPGSDIGTRKSSTATASTITPVNTMPHFSTRRPARGTGPLPRPGSSGSLATDDLLRSLHRGDSAGHYSSGSTDSQGHNSRWGSMISGFWGSKRRDSTADSSPPKMDGLVINDPHFQPADQQKKWKLADMVEEVRNSPLQPEPPNRVRKSESGSTDTARPKDEVDKVTEQTIQVVERIPDPSGAFESPVKTSISASDGVIDIDVPLPEYLSFETAVSSPSSSAYSFTAPGFNNGMDSFEHYCRSGLDTETTMNVGGWLPQYDPDFVLQAIPTPTDNSLITDIKESLRAEPTPVLAVTPGIGDADKGERWIDISSAIVADTTNFTIKHIRYRRLIKPAVSTPGLPLLSSRYGNVYSSVSDTPGGYGGQLDEMFVEEPIISMDDTLIDAVERIIAKSGNASRTASTSSSRSPSRKGVGRRRSNSEAFEPERSEQTPARDSHLEVPRTECKKMVLTALEEIVRSVVDSREKEGAPATPHERYEGKLGATERERESFLREGVRAWLGSVEGE